MSLFAINKDLFHIIFFIIIFFGFLSLVYDYKLMALKIIKNDSVLCTSHRININYDLILHFLLLLLFKCVYMYRVFVCKHARAVFIIINPLNTSRDFSLNMFVWLREWMNEWLCLHNNLNNIILNKSCKIEGNTLSFWICKPICDHKIVILLLNW